MATIVLRTTKGSALTFQEVDDNFFNLARDTFLSTRNSEPWVASTAFVKGDILEHNDNFYLVTTGGTTGTTGPTHTSDTVANGTTQLEYHIPQPYTHYDVFEKVKFMSGGGGNGLNADTLDNIQGESFLRSDATDTYSGGTLDITTKSAANIDAETGVINGLKITQPNAGADAIIGFDVSGDFAGYFGLDGNINDFAVGGWSFGANRYRVWHEGNIAPIQAADNVTVTGTWSFNNLIYIESNKHSITANDGGGNFNIRVGNEANASPNFTEDGYASHWVYNQTNGQWAFKGSTASGITGSAVTWQTNLTLDANGDLTATGDVTAFSDERLKTDIEKIPNALDKISNLSGYTYTRTDINKRQAGVIAQEVVNVLPEVVTTNDEGIMSVAYGNMVGLLIESIKELKSENEILKQRLDKLESNEVS